MVQAEMGGRCLIILLDTATLSGDQRKDDGKTDRPWESNGQTTGPGRAMDRVQGRWIFPLADLRVR